MTLQNSNVTNNSQGQSELNVKANSGDQVQWFMTTFDNNVDYIAFCIMELLILIQLFLV
ncbi:hypothetical protein C3B47_11630 [Flavobacterium columnare]|uniref:Uncharacterized protein n=1 Tax=Flavobacterium columnare TaxID=996 RepID=A0AAJ3ZKM9_9FLAO|nr:AidA/PixA family protein [Flavobacterium columnare]MBF6653529.1 hypothetical protein [Flavobacterium columnare]MBF6656247.1 hypothetical protein [Flavobacterium columnare]MBF6658941.1 hypothetical protein [Flavobacterium columnare]PTD14937.1 hypothetical protein C6N29_11130 [Flavobacterium columnare]QCV57140.1 hypothetical protein UN65_14830 [Flavobacterium columnare]